MRRRTSASSNGLIERHAVLLGGSFASAAGDLGAAYLLRCGGVEEARAIDPDHVV